MHKAGVAVVLVSIGSLLIGFLVGYLGQRSRICFIGGFRDYFLIRDGQLLKGLSSFFITAFGVRLVLMVLKSYSTLPVQITTPTYPAFNLVVWNSFAWISLGAGILLGFFSTLSNACPLRHHVLIGQGRVDSVVFLVGFYAGIVCYYSFIGEMINQLFAGF